MGVTVADVTGLLDGWYDPAWAEQWDAVGLVCGDPAHDVARVLFAVDPVPAVVDEALDWGADLVVVHHPLLLRPVHSVAMLSPKGRTVNRLVRSGTALFTAHTNADVPPYGVNESLALAVGVRDLEVVADHGAGGDRGPDPRRGGHGRVGRLPEPMTLRAFAEQVGRSLPATSQGVRAAGDPDRRVQRVAVASGAGDFLLDAVRSIDADVYLTSDLRHHRAAEFLEYDGPALLDVAHWAAEWTWLPVVQRRVTDALAQRGDTVETRVSTRVTDPWTFRYDA